MRDEGVGVIACGFGFGLDVGKCLEGAVKAGGCPIPDLTCEAVFDLPK